MKRIETKRLPVLRLHVFNILITAALMFALGIAEVAFAAEPDTDGLSYHREENVIYGRSYGTALTMDVLTPKEDANGIGVIYVVSGGYFSSPDAIRPAVIELRCGALLRRGYTVFAVVHGSQPKFTIPEAVKDINRAVRYIRHHADAYGIDPERIGIFGGSAGGHLSLMQGIAPQPPDPESPDPVERASSRAQAVAVFYPPTDWLNFGEEGRVNLGTEQLTVFRAAFDFIEYDEESRRLLRITDEERRIAIGRSLSPVYYVEPGDAPTLIVHGDADRGVPIQQAHRLIERLDTVGVPAKLIVKRGAGHGWPGMEKDVEDFADWFDQHLLGSHPARPDATGTARNNPTVTVEVGSSVNLAAVASGLRLMNPDDLEWHSSDPSLAQVYPNGFVVGLRPGAVTVRAVRPNDAGPGAQWTVRVDPVRFEVRDPASLRQYPDNRQFRVDGRRFVGTELNGQAVTPDDREATQANRIINPQPLSEEHFLEWEVKEGTEMFDGQGVLMGTVAPWLSTNGRVVPTSRFNYGVSKVIDGRLLVYGFMVRLIPDESIIDIVDPESVGSGIVMTSAWLRLDDVVEKEALLERINVGHTRLPALPLEDERFHVVGGDREPYMTEAGELSIITNIRHGAVPSHYLRRPTGTVNIIYSVPGFALGGQALDSLLITSRAIFRPAKGAKRFTMPTYYPEGHERAGDMAEPTMTFLYGAVEVEGSDPVFGWVAREALTPAR